MSKPWSPRSSRARSEGGFTFIEALVGMALLSVVGVATSRGLSQALRSVARTGASLASSARLARLDDTVRSLSARVRAPFWAGGHAVVSGPDELRVGWLDGESERELCLSFHDGVVTVGDGRLAERYAGFLSAGFSVVTDAQERTAGVRLDLLLSDTSRVTVLARLGSVPLLEASTR